MLYEKEEGRKYRQPGKRVAEAEAVVEKGVVATRVGGTSKQNLHSGSTLELSRMRSSVRLSRSSTNQLLLEVCQRIASKDIDISC